MNDLGLWLIDKNRINREQLDKAKAFGQEKGIPLTLALIDLKIVEEQELVDLLAAHYQLPKAPKKLHKLTIPSKALSYIPQDHCWQHGLFPFALDVKARVLQIAILDPTDQEAIQFLQNLPGALTIKLHIAGPKQIERGIRKHYLDAWVDDSATPLKFFGYDNITYPGKSSDNLSAVKREKTTAGHLEAAKTDSPSVQIDQNYLPEPALEFIPAKQPPNTEAGERPLAHSRNADEQHSHPAIGRLTTKELDRVTMLTVRVEALECALQELLTLLTNNNRSFGAVTEKILEDLQTVSGKRKKSQT